MNKENWKMRIYLAGHSKDLDYRKFVKDYYSDKIDIVDPMSITWDDVDKNIENNIQDIWIVRRDKKLIDGCDLVVAKIDYLKKREISIGTFFEIAYAFEKGIPVYVISCDEILENVWLKFYYKNGFNTIKECFNFIIGV